MTKLTALAAGVSLLAMAACGGSVNLVPGASTTGGTTTTTSSTGTGGTATTTSASTGGTPAPDLPWSKSFGAPGIFTRGAVTRVNTDDSVVATSEAVQQSGLPAPPYHLRQFDPAGDEVADVVLDDQHLSALDADGSTVVALPVSDGASTTVAGTQVACEGGLPCTVLARVGADGTLAWARTVEAQGSSPFASIDQVQITAGGRIAVTGVFTGTLDLGAGPLSSDGGTPTLYAAELSSDGAAVWSRAIRFLLPPGPSSPWSLALGMAVSPTGDLIIGGYSAVPIDFGDGVVQAVSGPSGYFARYDTAGNVVHRGIVPSPGAYWDAHVATDGAGNAVLAAWIHGTFDLGGGTTGTPGENQLYLVRFDPAGNLLGSHMIAAGADYPDLTVFHLAADAAGDAWLCGDTGSPITLGGTPVQSVSQRDILLLKIDPAGNLVAQRQFGTTGKLACYSLVLGPTGVPVICGTMTGSADFGQGLLQAVGTADMFIAKLGPGGP